MVNERNPPRTSTDNGKGKTRVSLIPEEEVDQDGNPPTPYHIQDQVQLEFWMKKDPELVFSMFNEMRKDYEDVVTRHNVLKPVAYFSQKMTPAECNYMIYDKELLVIVKSFETWRPELIDAEKDIKVLTNHRNLEYFIITKNLNRRQIRWAEMLFEYEFKIMYRSEKQGEKSDSLTRRRQNLSEEIENARNEYQHQILINQDQLDDKVKQDLRLCIMTRAVTQRMKNSLQDSVSEEVPIPEKVIVREEVPVSEKVNDDSKSIAENNDLDSIESQKKTDMKELLEKAYDTNEKIKTIINAKKTRIRKLSKKGTKLSLENIELRDNRVYHKNRLMISNSNELRLHLLKNIMIHHFRDIQNIEICTRKCSKTTIEKTWKRTVKDMRTIVRHADVSKHITRLIKNYWHHFQFRNENDWIYHSTS